MVYITCLGASLVDYGYQPARRAFVRACFDIIAIPSWVHYVFIRIDPDIVRFVAVVRVVHQQSQTPSLETGGKGRIESPVSNHELCLSQLFSLSFTFVCIKVQETVSFSIPMIPLPSDQNKALENTRQKLETKKGAAFARDS